MKRFFFAVLFLFLFPLSLKAAELMPTLELLQEIIRTDTSNPPGSEAKLAHFVQNYLQRFGDEKLQSEKALNAMLRNTINPTMLEAGYKVNIIPDHAAGSVYVAWGHGFPLFQG